MVASVAARDEALEALRGLAALAVVAWHLLLGFMPARSGVLPGFDPALSWIGTPWYGLLHGSAAVAFFFVLSGLVLSRRALRQNDPAIPLTGTLKRWPRLAGPVMLSCVGSWALFAAGAYAYQPAAAMTGSPWLAGFAYAGLPPGFVPDPAAALAQGAIWTFLRGDAFYNSSLWTMRWEFLGSFLVFGLCLILMALRGPRLQWAVLLPVLGVVAWWQPWLACFPLGMAVALLSARRPSPRFPASTAAALVLLALGCAGYAAMGQAGRWSAQLLNGPAPEPLVHGLGAVSLILAVEGHDGLRRFFTGACARWLGRMSFPIYLVHVPVLCSAGSAAFVVLGGGRTGLAAAAGVTLALTLVLAWPLARFDLWWVGRINALAARVRPAPASA